jgi:hypothetical protein
MGGFMASELESDTTTVKADGAGLSATRTDVGERAPERLSRARRTIAVLLALLLAVGAGVFVVNPWNQQRIYVGGYTIRVPKDVRFERTNAGEYRLLLEQEDGLFVNRRETARIASRVLLGDLSGTSMVRRVIGTGWFPKDTRVCLSGYPTTWRGRETWAVQYYGQTYFNGEGLPYRERHGVLVIRNRPDGGGLVMDVSRMSSSPALTTIDWEPVRSRLRTLLRSTRPSPAGPRGFWDEPKENLRGVWTTLLNRERVRAKTPSPLDAPAPPSLPLCLGPYPLNFEKPVERPYKRDNYDGLRISSHWLRPNHDLEARAAFRFEKLGERPYKRDTYSGSMTSSHWLRPSNDLEARVAFRVKPFRVDDPVGFAVVRSGWLANDECARGFGPRDVLHNRKGVMQSYERFSHGQRYVGIMAVIRTKASGALIFDVFDPRPTVQDQDVERLENYLMKLKDAVIVGEYTVSAKGERNQSITIGSCPVAPAK